MEYMKVDFQQNVYQNSQSFQGAYIVQIPRKLFSDPENIHECSKLVDKQISKFMYKSKIMQMFSRLLHFFSQNLYCSIEKFSYMFSKIGMEGIKFNCSVPWLRANTKLPIADALREGYHSFFVYTKDDAHNVLKEVLSKTIKTQAPEYFGKYSDPNMFTVARMAKAGVALDKVFEKQYETAPIYEIEKMADLKEVAQKIKKADSIQYAVSK